MQPGQANSQQNQQNKVYHDKNLIIIFAVSLIAVLGVGSVTPAFPKLAQALHVQPQNIGLLVTVFTFPAFALEPLIGVLADRFGRKKVIVPSLFLFGIAGCACAFAAHDRGSVGRSDAVCRCRLALHHRGHLDVWCLGNCGAGGRRQRRLLVV